ncbi:hypothetical protein VPHK251G3_0067 [Vibrio phage K251 g3]
MDNVTMLYVVIGAMYMLGFLLSVAYCNLAIELRSMPKPKHKLSIIFVSIFWFLLTMRCTMLIIKGYRQL